MIKAEKDDKGLFSLLDTVEGSILNEEWKKLSRSIENLIILTNTKQYREYKEELFYKKLLSSFETDKEQNND